jgi:acylphosphatase
MATDELVSAQLRITGRVQGVWYRASAAQEARRLGLTGWVRNARDGSVEALAQGPNENVASFIDWCRDGPTGAIVGNVEVQWQDDPTACSEFTVRY